MYRAVNDKTYPPESANTGNLAGVMWYLQHEVVIKTPPKFGITRILRFVVKTKTTSALFAAGMNFGVRYAFDAGQCTGPFDCNTQWNKYGYFVGCNNLGSFPYPQFEVPYANAIWYSLPGACPGNLFSDKSASCRAWAPGGSCKEPTGQGNCTYSFEPAGELLLSELQANISWDRPDDTEACAERLRTAEARFDEKYPKAPAAESMQAPPCDFNFDKFYR